MDIFVTSYLITINILAFILYGVDKYKAINNRWRISERTLLGFAVFGGSLGAFVGMNVFQHKTSVRVFSIGVPVMFIIQLALLLYFYVEIYDRTPF